MKIQTFTYFFVFRLLPVTSYLLPPELNLPTLGSYFEYIVLRLPSARQLLVSYFAVSVFQEKRNFFDSNLAHIVAAQLSFWPQKWPLAQVLPAGFRVWWSVYGMVIR